jgi:hypothetical protein
MLKWGTALAAGTITERAAWPLNASAQRKTNPRGTARNCIVLALGGAPSQKETFDFKEERGQPDLDVRKISSDLYLSYKLFPTLSQQMDKIAIVRTLRTFELVHFQALYHAQTGRALNPALAREIPAFGSIVAYELDGQRSETDTFPPYVSTGLTYTDSGAIGAGFLPPQFAGLDVDATTVFDMMTNNEGVNKLLQTRFKLLAGWSEVSGSGSGSLGSKTSDFRVHYNDAYRILNDPRWARTFAVTPEEKKRYGETKIGMGALLARNLVAADAGTHMIYIEDGGWDHHDNIFGNKGANLFTSAAGLDKALSNLLKDLSSMPGHAAGKTLLDETLIVARGEFGRTPHFTTGQGSVGRDHWPTLFPAVFAGGGVKGGRILGKSDERGADCIDTGWKHKEQPWHDNVIATIYSALGIDWRKRITTTPSGRAYAYVQSAPVAGSEFISDDAIDELFV